MGSGWYHAREARERLLGDIVSGEYKYIVTIVGTKKETGKLVEKGHQLFKELNEPALRDYATSTSAENDVQLVRIRIWSLEAKVYQELEYTPR